MKYTIDAAGKKLGRIASEAATMLMGKKTPDYARNKLADVVVEVTNAGKLSVSDKKKTQEKYSYYSGYPGGFREEKLGEAMSKKGNAFVIRKTVLGMLPKNKLAARMIKNLKIVE